MQNYILVFLLFLSACNTQTATVEKRKRIAFLYKFQQHEDWQDIILDLTNNYDLVFLNRTKIKNFTKWQQQNKFDIVIGEQNIKHKQYINLNTVRQQIIKQKTKSQRSITTIDHKTMNKICRGHKSWVIDLPKKATVDFLKRMPRTCDYKHISTTADISEYKNNIYLENILKPIEIIIVSDKDVLAKAIHLIHND